MRVQAPAEPKRAESFDAFGSRRNPSTWSGAPTNSDLTTIAGISREGYTFQTALGIWMGMNHMNGRVEDSITGRFLSADPYIPDATNSQNYNRYSYAINNPLTLTDPSGFDEDDPAASTQPTDGSPPPLEVVVTATRFGGSGGSPGLGGSSPNGTQSKQENLQTILVQGNRYPKVPPKAAGSGVDPKHSAIQPEFWEEEVQEKIREKLADALLKKYGFKEAAELLAGAEDGLDIVLAPIIFADTLTDLTDLYLEEATQNQPVIPEGICETHACVDTGLGVEWEEVPYLGR